MSIAEPVSTVEPVQRRSIPAAAWIAAAAVLGLAVGLASGLLVPQLSRPGETSAEAGFARDMSTHHAQAVEMGQLAYAHATDAEVRTLGQDIALTQQAQIGMMSAWLQEWHVETTGDKPPMAWMHDGGDLKDGLMPGMATQQEVASLRDATGKDVDRQFLALMRQHHLGGIHMAEALVHASHNDEVVALAKTMINGQQNEIAVIEQLLTKVGAGG